MLISFDIQIIQIYGRNTYETVYSSKFIYVKDHRTNYIIRYNSIGHGRSLHRNDTSLIWSITCTEIIGYPYNTRKKRSRFNNRKKERKKEKKK